jgi:hypothetical protein
MDSWVTKTVIFCRRLALLAVFSGFCGASASAQTGNQDAIRNLPTLGAPTDGPSPGATTAQLWPDSVSYSANTTFFTTDVQADLRPVFSYSYDFRFSLKARADGNKQDVPDGIYQLSLAVFRKGNRLELHDRFVTGTSQMTAKVTGGAFGKTVTLRFENITATAILSTLVVELIPLSETCNGKPCFTYTPNGEIDYSRSQLKARSGYRPYLFEMNFVPFLPKDSAFFDPNSPSTIQTKLGQQSLASFVLKARQMSEEKRLATKTTPPTAEQYAEHKKLHFISLNDQHLQAANNRWAPKINASAGLKALLSAKGFGMIQMPQELRPLINVLCGTLALKNESLKYVNAIQKQHVLDQVSLCTRKAEEFFRMSRLTHVGRINRSLEIERTPVQNLAYTVTQNFIVSRSSSSDTFTSWTFKPLFILFKAMDSLGIPSPVDFSHTVSQSNGRSQSESGISSMQDVMSANPLLLNIPTARSRQCLEFQVDPNSGWLFYDKREGAKNGLYICGEIENDVVVQEIYGHIYTRGLDASNSQAYDPATQGVNISLRGDREISSFFYSIRGALRSKQGDTLFSSSGNGLASYLAGTARLTPGVVVTPVAFAGESLPSFAEKALGLYAETFF